MGTALLKLLNIFGNDSANAEGPDERRGPDDRRERPTRPFSRYWLRGRRRAGRRDDESANIYVDRYTGGELFLVLGVLVLSLLDMAFTLFHLNAGGTEANPVMDFALQVGGHFGFKVVKILTTVLGLLVLLVHVRFKRVRTLLTFAFVVYSALFLFHLYITWLRFSAHLV